MFQRPPVDAVVFEPDALFDLSTAARRADVARPRPGSRRLVSALTRAGITVAVRAAATDARVAQGAAGGRPVGPGADDPPGAGESDVIPDGPSADLLRRWLAGARLGDVSVTAPGGQPVAAPDRTLEVPGGPAPSVGPVRNVYQRLNATAATGPAAAAGVLVAPLDAGSLAAAEERHRRLTKPPGSLGRLEAIGAQLAGIAAEVPPPLPRPAAVAVFAGDHGVHGRGVSPWPQEVTAQMVANFLSGGAAINVLARHAGAEVVVVDVGVATPLPGPPPGAAGEPGHPSRLLDRKVRAGTADLSTGPAMSVDEARRALDIGVEVAVDLVDRGARCLVTGDMGIANTTPSAALVAALTNRPAAAVTGPGAGLAAGDLAHKVAVVEAAAARARDACGGDPLAVLAEVGGLEHAALAGFVIGGAALQVPVVIDGVIAASSLLAAARLVPGVERSVIAGHRSVEPGSAAVLDELRLDPVVDLGLRLGEGTGAALALPLVEAAALVLDEMATFDQAGVSGKGA